MPWCNAVNSWKLLSIFHKLTYAARSAQFRTLPEQEAVQACLRDKYPDGSVNKVVAASPDLAIVQGAALYAPTQQPPAPQYHAPVARGAPPAPAYTVPHYPPTTQYNAITAPNSYGILTTEVQYGKRLSPLHPNRLEYVCSTNVFRPRFHETPERGWPRVAADVGVPLCVAGLDTSSPEMARQHFRATLTSAVRLTLVPRAPVYLGLVHALLYAEFNRFSLPGAR